MILNYSDYDFDKIVEQLVNYLSTTDTWKDVYISATGQTLIEMMAAVGDMINYYIQRRAEELYFSTLQLRSSAVALARNRGYNVSRRVSASGTLLLTVSSETVTRFIVEGSIFEAENGVQYVCTETTEIPPLTTEVSVPVVQGIWQEVSFVSTGDASQYFEVIGDSIENTHYEVWVYNGVVYEKWTEVDNFFLSEADDQVYMAITSESGLIVRFSNGVFGAIPPSTMNIKVKYLDSLGEDGNLYEEGAALSVTSLAGIFTGTIDSVVTESQLLGGANEEDIESIKFFAPLYVTTGDRAVTASDYLYFLHQYPGVVAAKAWGESEESAPNIDMFNRVKIACLFSGDFRLDELTPDVDYEFTVVRRNGVSDLLENKKAITVTPLYVKTDVLGLVFDVQVYHYAGYSSSEMETTVRTELETLFSYENADYGKGVRYSDIVRAIDAITGVSYITLKLGYIKRHYINDTGVGWTAMPVTTIGFTDMTPGSCKIYVSNSLNNIVPDPTVEHVLIAHDDGSGNLVGDNGLTVTGFVNYNSGQFQINTVDVTLYGPAGIQATSDVLQNVVAEKQEVTFFFDATITAQVE